MAVIRCPTLTLIEHATSAGYNDRVESDSHIPEETLEACSLETLAEAEAAALEEHLLVCSACQERLAEMDSFVRGMQAAGKRLRDTPPE